MFDLSVSTGGGILTNSTRLAATPNKAVDLTAAWRDIGDVKALDVVYDQQVMSPVGSRQLVRPASSGECLWRLDKLLMQNHKARLLVLVLIHTIELERNRHQVFYSVE